MRRPILLIGVLATGLALGSMLLLVETAGAKGLKVVSRTLINTGYAVDNVATGVNLVAFQVIEANQGAGSLNGDFDTDDKVIHVLDTVTGSVRNLGLAGGWPVVNGALVAFAVPEEDQSSADLNGDGDRIDSVWHVYNARTGVTSNLGLAITAWDIQVGDPLVLARVSESRQGASDLNSDGDATDWVAYVHDADSGTTTNLALAVDVDAASRFDCENGIAAFFVDEADQNATDLNGDGDAVDLVVHTYDVATTTLTNTQLASNPSTAQVELESGKAVIRVSEFCQGQTDLNGDADPNDNVLVVHDVATTAQANVGYECASDSYIGVQSYAVDGNLVAFRYSEGGQGVDGNSDGDLNDAIYAIYDIAAATVTDTGFAGPQYSLALHDGYAAFLVVERHQGDTILNGDGDTDDWVLHLYDHGLKATSNLVSASSTYSHGLGGGMVGVQVREAEEGSDLNGDGDTDDKVIVLHDVTGGPGRTLALASGGSTWVADISDEVLAFRTRESDQGATDLNGDGDTLDFVGHLHDLATGETTNLELATETIAVIGRTVAFRVNESQQGMTDLNGDGDATDAVLFVTVEAIFADGFETGTTSGWSSAVP
jgi:hypothetical protein